MATTQFDIIRRQGEAALRNELSRSAAAVRRETSLVGQANRLFSAAVRNGEAAIRSAQAGPRREPGRNVAATAPDAVRPAPDGYMRRSPVQPVYEAVGYRKNLIKRAVGVVLLLAAAGVALYFMFRLRLPGQ